MVADGRAVKLIIRMELYVSSGSCGGTEALRCEEDQLEGEKSI